MKAASYGGVLFNHNGEVLLRRPSNGYGGDKWTFPKGRPNDGETPEEAALREVLEETGYHARVVCPVPGEYEGDVTLNQYFVMRPIGDTEGIGSETEEQRWVGIAEAVSLINGSTALKRKRDLAVLGAACNAYSQRFPNSEMPA